MWTKPGLIYQTHFLSSVGPLFSWKIESLLDNLLIQFRKDFIDTGVTRPTVPDATDLACDSFSWTEPFSDPSIRLTSSGFNPGKVLMPGTFPDLLLCERGLLEAALSPDHTDAKPVLGGVSLTLQKLLEGSLWKLCLLLLFLTVSGLHYFVHNHVKYLFFRQSKTLSPDLLL